MPELSTNIQRKRIIRLSDVVARLVKDASPLRKEKARLDREYDKAWEERNMKKVGTYTVRLKKILRRLQPLTERIVSLENTIRTLQRQLTGN